MRNLLIATLAFALLGLGWFVPSDRSAELIIQGHDHTWVGSYANINFQIVPPEGLQLKEDAPLRVKVVVTPNLSTSPGTLRAKEENFMQGVAMFNILVRGEKPGLGKVTADVSYFLCSDTICKRYTDTISHPVYVKKDSFFYSALFS